MGGQSWTALRGGGGHSAAFPEPLLLPKSGCSRAPLEPLLQSEVTIANRFSPRPLIVAKEGSLCKIGSRGALFLEAEVAQEKRHRDLS